LVQLIIEKPVNNVLDCYSAAPAAKFEILDAFKNKFGLRYIISKTADVLQATGSKNIYYSKNRKAEEIGFKPLIKSLDCLIKESEYLMRTK